MRITGNVMIRHSTDGSIRESRIEYDKDSEPHSLTIMRLKNGKQFRNRYIVSVKDGTLRLASSMNGSSQLPEAFDAPRTVVQTYRRHHSTQTTELASPEATLDQMTQYGNAKDYHGLVSLLTDQEAARMSGLMMMSATSLLTIQGLVTSAAGDVDVPEDLPVDHVASVMQKYIRKDAPPEALSAFRALTTKAAGLIVGQIPGASIDSQDSSLPADTPEELSQLLLAAADALSDQRAFCAEMLEALDQVSPSENKDQTPSWQITQSEDAAVAVDTRPEASEGDTSTMAGSIEVELQRVDGRWLITRLISDDQLQQMLNGPADADSTTEAEGQHYPATLEQSPPTEFLPAPNDNTNAPDSLIPTFSASTEFSAANAESITIRSTGQTSDAPKVSWGPTQNGLQMAVTTDSPNTPMASPLTVSCLLKNVSDHEIAIVDDGWSLSVETDIRRTSQAQLQTILGAVSGAFTPEKFVLGPGEQRVVASARIRVTDDTEVESAPPQADVLIVDSKARQFHNAIYVLRCRLNMTLDDVAKTRVPLESAQTAIAFSSPE